MTFDEECAQNLALQLAMNVSLWQALLDNGVTEETEVELEFLYYAPNKDKAAALKSTLEEYDYKVTINQSGTFLRRVWTVGGTTSKTTLTLPKLNQWVDWMIAAGKEHGSTFDGWGTLVG